jgi:energy-converting hydrogenase Eha subunit H
MEDHAISVLLFFGGISIIVLLVLIIYCIVKYCSRPVVQVPTDPPEMDTKIITTSTTPLCSAI